MTFKLPDGVKQNSNSLGDSGAIVVTGTPPEGFKTFAATLSNGDETIISRRAGADFETLYVTYDSTNDELDVLAVIAGTNGASRVDWQATVQDIFVGLAGPAAVMKDSNGNVVDGAGNAIPIGGGQCQLQYVSSTQIKLVQFNGQSVRDGSGAGLTVPSAGVTYTISGLSADTTYYVYAYDNGGDGAIDTLDVTVTAPVTATNGIRHKTGAAARPLVGMARTNGSTQFADSPTHRFVRTWFNDRGVAGKDGGQSVALTVGGVIEITAGPTVDILTWADEPVTVNLVFSGTTSGSNNTVTWQAGRDGSGVSTTLSAAGEVGFAAIYASAHNEHATEGRHYWRAFAGINGSSHTATFELSVLTSGG